MRQDDRDRRVTQLKGAYELWHVALQLSRKAGYRWSDHVERDFGAAVDLPFDQWWEQCEHLFQDEPMPLVHVVRTADDFDFWHKDALTGDSVVLAINLVNTVERIRVSIDEVLKQFHDHRPGKPPEYESNARYSLRRVPDSRGAVRRALLMFRLKVIERTPLTYSEIAQQHKITFDGDVSVTLSRALGYGRRLVEGVAEGIFPAK